MSEAFNSTLSLSFEVRAGLVFRQMHHWAALIFVGAVVVHLWPTYAARSIGLFAGVFGLIAFLGGLAQVNPIWLYGPFQPAAVTTASQPDWYMGWVEGALRLAPGWRIHLFGNTISELFWPG